MAFVGSAKFAFLVQTIFLIMASHPAICANPPASKEQDTDPPGDPGNVPTLRHLMKRHALHVDKDVEVYDVPSTPAPRPMATALENTGQILRLATLLPAKSLQLLRMVGVGLLNTSIGIPETILEKASELSLSDLHFGRGPPATTTPPTVEVHTEPAVKPDHPAPARDWLSELVALKLQKLALLKQIKLLKHQHHGDVVIRKHISIGPHGVKKNVLVIVPKTVVSVPVPPVTTTPSPVPELTTPIPVQEIRAPIEEVTTPVPPPQVTSPLPVGEPEQKPNLDLPEVIVLTDEPVSAVTDPVTTESDTLLDHIKDKLSDNEIAAPLKPTSVQPSPPKAKNGI